ncbi:pyrroline-5-carboxylate reductase [Lysinibacillus alkalisoli]|uniref:Pyrroline-5-carboxylate reductase n=1 Tax=Lysinibacillus alkalisoli TaxID=1911548 RepID=A0A917LJG2_9BACI|nr:pyrroline-5-carboxylate reductase [Lysinibacillus alkalisoli]GGG31749.1 pyrroline-5-carboxylate reductase [Lysinibacillus alkalisoli]
MKEKNIVFLGAGSIAEAFVKGLIHHDVVTPHRVAMKNHSNHAHLHYLHETYGTSFVEGDQTFQQADIIVLAMKPKDVDCLADIAHLLQPHTMIISILAGVTFEGIEKYVGTRPIARLMPNTSAMLGLSASGAAFNKVVSQEEREQLLTFFRTVGTVEIVDEAHMHAITAIAGSGPAYFYYFVECLEQAGVALGLDAKKGRELIIQSMKGAAAMLEATGEEPSVLRENITSPNGTTFEALEVFRQAQLAQIIQQATEANANRSKTFSELYR